MNFAKREDSAGDPDTTASPRAVACALLSAGDSRPFHDRHPAFCYENCRRRKDKLVNCVCAFAVKMRRRNPKGQMDVIQSCYV